MRSEQRQAEAQGWRIHELECEVQRQANLLSDRADQEYALRALRLQVARLTREAE